MNQLVEGVVSIAVAITGIAILAVLVGERSKTSTVIQAAGSAFSQSIAAAVSPVTGGTGGFGGYATPSFLG